MVQVETIPCCWGRRIGQPRRTPCNRFIMRMTSCSRPLDLHPYHYPGRNLEEVCSEQTNRQQVTFGRAVKSLLSAANFIPHFSPSAPSDFLSWLCDKSHR